MSLHYQRGNEIGPDLHFTPQSPLVKLLDQNPGAYVYADIQQTLRGSFVVVEVLLPKSDDLYVAGRIPYEFALYLSHQLQDDRQVLTSQGLVAPLLQIVNRNGMGSLTY
ncbi:MAG: hypothetical protein AABX70_06260 [Nanoarchaeota archaeon]